MKLDNLKIGTLLRFGFGSILLLVLILCTITWRQTDILWKQTQNMHNHPLTVTRALGQLKAKTRELSLHTKEMFLARTDMETMAILQEIEADKVQVASLFPTLLDRYLGPREDIEILQQEFAKWNAMRDETIRLLRMGEKHIAEDRIHPSGSQASQAAVVDTQLHKIENFARNKAEEFYQNSTSLKSSLNQQLAWITATTLIFALLIGGYILRKIKTPLSELTRLSKEFTDGKLDVRSNYISNNEIGSLSTAFNVLADTIQTQRQISEHASALSATMLREEEIHPFCHELLKSLLKHTNSQAGAIYFLNEAKTDFERIESIGLTVADQPPFSAAAFEGEPGATAAANEIRRITDIPPDTRFRHNTMSGEIIPREILNIPVLSDNYVVSVISLASVHAYDASTLKLIDDLRGILSARIEGIMAFRKLSTLAEKLELQNRELDEQRRELSAQASELTEQNIELEMQKRHLDEVNRLKSAFLSNMSHELRTPLNSVIALSGVLSRRLVNTIPEEEFGYLKIIQRNGKNLLELINDILDLSRIEAGHEEITLSHYSIRELLDEIVAMLEPLALEKNIALNHRTTDNLPTLYSDQAKCRHILQNIVSNAVKFTEHGEVVIETGVNADHIEISVIDTGIGILAKDLPFIFDEFRQGDGSTSRKFEGTGLGLAIARKYARMLEGNISVRSEPGKGSTFTLRLPLNANTDTKRPSIPETHLSPALSNPPVLQKNILIVEDSEPAIIQLTDILQSQGHRLQVARNGKEALACIGQMIPDAMILDLMMPEVDGFQVLRSVREHPETCRLPVLILTAKHISKEELGFLKHNHVFQLIQKGDINREGLLGTISAMVRTDAISDQVPPPRKNRLSRLVSSKPLALIVEDNADNRQTLVALLQNEYRIIEAADGQSGLEMAAINHPDVILMDIAMPVLDGIQALNRLRDDHDLADIPVIAVTASAMRGECETLLARGFDACLTKPIDETLLIKTLREILC